MPGSETSNRIKFYYVYVLQSQVDKTKLYTGYTHNLKNRLHEHNEGLNQSTIPYKPWKLIYYEACLHQEDARRREGYFKTTQGRRLLKRRLKEYFYLDK